jgi:excisionase family DNA binding protein
MESLLTVREASMILHVHPETLRRYIREGKILATKNGIWRMQESDVEKFANGGA